MCMIDDCEAFTISNERTVKNSRKEHKCAECCRVIPKGSAYRCLSGLFEGSWQTYHTCEHCMAGAIAWLMMNCNGSVLALAKEDLFEHFTEEASAYPPGDKFRIGRILVGMERKWIKPNGQLMSLPPPALNVARFASL